MFIQVIQGRALDPPGIRRELNRWQRQLATDAAGWLGATAGVTKDGWSVVVMCFDSERQARRSSDRPSTRRWRVASQHLARSPSMTPPGGLFGDAAEPGRLCAGHPGPHRRPERMASLGGGQEGSWPGKRRTFSG